MCHQFAADALPLAVGAYGDSEQIDRRDPLVAKSRVSGVAYCDNCISDDGLGIPLLGHQDPVVLALPEFFHDEARVGLSAALEGLSVNKHECWKHLGLLLLCLLDNLDDNVVAWVVLCDGLHLGRKVCV